MWVLTKDMLRRFVSHDVRIVSKKLDELEVRVAGEERARKKAEKEVLRLSDDLQAARSRIALLEEIEEKAVLLKEDLAKSEVEVEKGRKREEELLKKMEEMERKFKEKLEAAKAEAAKKAEALWQARLDALQKSLEAAQNKAQELLEEKRALERRLKDSDGKKIEMLKTQESFKKMASSAKDMRDSMTMDVRMEVLRLLLQDSKLSDHVLSRKDGGAEGELQNIKADVLAKAVAALASSKAAPGEDGEGKRAPDPSKIMSEAEETRHAALCVQAADREVVGETGSKLLGDLLLAASLRVGYDADAEERLKKIKGELEEMRRMYEDALEKLNGEPREPAAAPREDVEEGEGEEEEQEANEGRDETKMKTLHAADTFKRTASEVMAATHKMRPRVLGAYKINPKIFKGKKINPMPPHQLFTMIANILEEKAKADAVDDSVNNRRDPFPEFIKEYLVHKFGLKSIALSNLQAIILGVKKGAKGDRSNDDSPQRLETFGLVAGIIDHDAWHEDLSNMILYALSVMFRMENIKENMDHGPKKNLAVDPSLALDSCTEAWSHYGFGEMPHELHDEIVNKSRQTGGALLLHDWIEIMTQAWLAKSMQVHKSLITTFLAHDSNGDQVLDYEEFHGMVRELTNDGGGEAVEVDEHMVSKIFSEALEESNYMDPSGDHDSMHPQAFVRVARQYHLSAQYNAAEPAEADSVFHHK